MMESALEAAMSWDEVRAWRRETRARLIERRVGVERAQRDEIRDQVATSVRSGVPGLARSCIGFYWPFKGEVDLRPLMRALLAEGATAALPAVSEKARPMEFRPWAPGSAMVPGIWNIPVPPPGEIARPQILLVALLGFDEAGYRLGYGGGYYDRTLAAMPTRPLTVGVGSELGRLDTIHPQPHDIPMDAVATESGLTWFDRARPALARIEAGAAADDPDYASPACFLHELDPSFLGYLDRPDTIALLNELLEVERAGARGVGEMSHAPGFEGLRPLLGDVARDEARFCAMLTRHIIRLGGTPSRITGAFYERLKAVADPAKRIDLLNRGQGWVARRLRECLPRIHDDALAADLRIMLDDHDRNVVRCGGSVSVG
jgi:5-formyltetrahydrofolate cyclo-ligase